MARFEIWISKKPIHFGHICWVSILFLVNTWIHVNGSMVPGYHRSIELLSRISPWPADGFPSSLPRDLRRDGCHIRKKWLCSGGKIFCGVLFWGGGVEMFGCYTFEIFWLTWYLQLSAWGLFWCASIPIGNIVGTKTHFTWTHLVLGPWKPRIYCWRNLPTQRKRLAHQYNQQQWPAGGVWDLNISTWQFFVTFLGWLSDPFQWLSDLQLGDEKVTLNHLVYIFIFCTRWAPSLVVTRYFFWP